MCGVAGVLSLKSNITEDDLRNVRNMTASLRHRGPDSEGAWHDERAALGNTRLTILDLTDNGNLPMGNDGRTVWIAYNGEVTNFRELKAQFRLEEKYRFHSTSDTEVLLHLYEELGIDFLRHLSGMFAFCLYDKRIGKAYVVRDFYGTRPLFTMARGDRLYFASEIKAFLDLPGFDEKLDHQALYDYLSLAYIPGRRTPFEKIREVLGGHLLEVDTAKGTVSEREYYRVHFAPDPSLREEETARALHDRMLDAVRRNLISDAPLGLTLSGGFDTGAILGLTHELGAAQGIHTFSIKMNEPSFDESRYQRLLADRFKPIHHEIAVNPSDVLEHLVRHMAYMDEPTGDGAAVPNYLLAREAKKYVKVLLSGEGGDEVFNAYETHGAFKARKLYRRWVPAPLRKLAAAAARRLPVSHKKLSLDFVAKRFTEGAERDAPEAHLFWRHVLTEEEKKRLLRRSDFPRTDRLFREMFDSLPFEDELNRISYVDMKYYFIDDLMVKNDRMFMAHSVEARFPYMDRLLVEFVGRIPSSLRIKGFQRRYIQKQAMRHVMPDGILRRKNMGLEMPHSLWFLKDFRAAAERYFSRESVERSGLLDHAAVEALWREHLAFRRDNGRALWCILIFLVWFDLFVYNRDHKKYRA